MRNDTNNQQSKGTTMKAATIKKSMRANHITIRQIADHMQITIKRVRQVRNYGVSCPVSVRDWRQAIAEIAQELPSGALTPQY